MPGKTLIRLILATLLAALSFAKTPLTHEKLWRMKRVGAPVASPDGRWAVVPVVEPAYDPKDQVSDLWLIATAGGEPKRLTNTKGTESEVHWSPDSRKILFTAKREGDEAAQIYLLDITGGEAARVTRQAGGASGGKFSPDGKRILYQADFDPIAAARKQRKANVRVFDTFPIRFWDHWLDEKRPHLFVQELIAGSGGTDLFEDSKFASSPGFDGVKGLSGSDLQAIWAPDSSTIVFTATENANAAAYALVVTNLYAFCLCGGEPERITDGKQSFGSPSFAPSGKSLYALQSREDGKIYGLSKLVRAGWPDKGSFKLVSEGFDRSIASYGVSRDNQTVYALAEEHGHEKLFAIPATGGKASLAVDLEQGVYSNLNASGGVLVANYQSSTSPAEVVRLDPATRSHISLTKLAAADGAEIDAQPPRHFWFTSKATGRKIHNMLFLPPEFDANKKYPLIAFIHGGPHTMSRDDFHPRWNINLLTAPGYLVLTTNYSGSTGFGEEFGNAIQGDPLKGPGAEINEAVDEAIRLFSFVDANRLAAGGASYGGHLANWLEATTTRFRCLFAHSGLIDLESQWGTSDTIYHRELMNKGPLWEGGKVWREQSPVLYAKQFKTPMLLSVGERDYRVPLNQTIENWSVLQRMKVPSRLLVFPDENHWILKGENHRFFIEELQAWLAKWLKP